jgi:hypothetical protein
MPFNLILMVKKKKLVIDSQLSHIDLNDEFLTMINAFRAKNLRTI